MDLVVGNEAKGTAVYKALGNRDVLRKLLDHFSHSELLGLSFVNKLWKEEARSLMLKRGNVVAHFSCDQYHPLCMDLKDFSAALEGMKTIPFSAISIQIGCKKLDQVCQAAAEDPFGVMHATLGKLAMVKRVSVNSVGDPFKTVNCTGVRLAENALQVFGANVDQLSLKGYKCRQQIELMEKIVGNSSLLNLKTLILDDRGRSQPEFFNYMKALISRAPNLVKLETAGIFTALEENIFEPNSNVVWLHHGDINRPWECIPESIIPNLSVYYLSLDCTIWEATFEFEAFNRKMPRILRSCYSTTLHAIDGLDAKFAVALMAYGISFEKVDNLYMTLDFRNLQLRGPTVLEIVKNFDFTGIFPSLTLVPICDYGFHDYGPLPDSYHRLLQLPLWREPRPDRAVNITEIFLHDQLGLTRRSARFFAQMFPAVQKIEFDESEGSDDIGLIGRHWPGLKELEIVFSERGKKNLDSIFCGVSRKEVTLLRRMDEGYLQSVEIVPAKSAITCMKNLRTLKIRFERPCIETALTMTKVTGFIAFSKLRCPNLEVTIQADPPTCKALSYMAPFASIVPVE